MEQTVKRARPLSPQALSEYFGVPLQTIYRWRTEGKGPKGYRVGKFVRYRLEDVEAWELEQLDKDSA